jgi:hypothetical protein
MIDLTVWPFPVLNEPYQAVDVVVVTIDPYEAIAALLI